MRACKKTPFFKCLPSMPRDLNPYSKRSILVTGLSPYRDAAAVIRKKRCVREKSVCRAQVCVGKVNGKGGGRPVSGDRSVRRGDRQTDRHRGKCERWEVGGALLKGSIVNMRSRSS